MDFVETVASYCTQKQAAGFRRPKTQISRTKTLSHMGMAACTEPSRRLLLLLLLFSVSICTSGTILSYSYDARGITTSGSTSMLQASLLSSLKLNHHVAQPSQIRVLVTDFTLLDPLSKSKHGSVPVQIYLNRNTHFSKQARTSAEASSLQWVKSNLRSYISRVNIESLTVSCSSDIFTNGAELQQLLSTLKTTYSLLTSLKLETHVRLSVALPLFDLNSLTPQQKVSWGRILRFLRSTGSSLVLEHDDHHTEDAESPAINRHQFVHSVISKARLVASTLPNGGGGGVPIILSMNYEFPDSQAQIPLFHAQILRSVERDPQIKDVITELHLRLQSPRQNNRFNNLQRRELQAANRRIKTTRHDVYDPAAPITNPATTPTTTIPAYNNPTPGVITVPGANPDTTGGIPSTTAPVTYPPAPVTPVSTAPNLPVTNPISPVTTDPGTGATGTQPVTNPVTTYPAPAGGTGTYPAPATTYPAPATTYPAPATGGDGTIPPANPVTTPVTSPGGGASTTPGQSWCVARGGVDQIILQSSLDYACGNGADCSMIQQGASCFDPNTLENHASYAFNSYYQKNPVSTSCDFGGAAVLVNTNPSSGSCVYPSSSGSAGNPSMLPPGTGSPSGVPVSSGTGSPSSYTGGGNTPMSPSSYTFGSQSPSITFAPPSGSHLLRPSDLVRYVTLVASLCAGFLLGL